VSDVLSEISRRRISIESQCLSSPPSGMVPLQRSYNQHDYETTTTTAGIKEEENNVEEQQDNKKKDNSKNDDDDDTNTTTTEINNEDMFHDDDWLVADTIDNMDWDEIAQGEATDCTTTSTTSITD